MSENTEKTQKLEESIERRKPSEEMVWLRHYENGAYEKANAIPEGITLWDFMENRLMEFPDIPALEYFKREWSRQDFISDVYVWARTFRAIGVEPDEIVPIYGPFFPDICAMACALNMIGATAYFLKLAISKNALEEETAKSKIAVVFDGMWNNVKEVFSDDRYKKILVASPTDALDNNAKAKMLKDHPIATIKNLIEKRKTAYEIPKTSKFVWLDDAKKIADYYTGNVKVDFKQDRDVYITSSSGTSLNGVVKGTITTNERAIAQILQGYYARVNYFPGKKCLTNLPPTASTSLNGLFLLPLYYGMTALIEPRLSELGYYDQVMTNKTPVTIMTGSFWESFFRRVEGEIVKGKRPDLSFADMFILGGEGANPENKAWFDKLMSECGSKYPMFSGCGMSEVFSVSSVEKYGIDLSAPKRERPVISVGIPYPGITVGIFDNDGNELSYNQRGELWIRGKSVMKGYYGKPELTAKTVDKNGWLHTGDMYDIDEDGQLYIWGRMDDKTILSDGTDFQLFDVAYQIKNDVEIKDCFVNAMPMEDDTDKLVAHVIFRNSNTNREEVYRRLDNMLADFLPSELSIAGYKEQMLTFKASPTTAKKDRNGLMKELDGYVKPTEMGMSKLIFVRDETTGKHTMQYSQ